MRTCASQQAIWWRVAQGSSRVLVMPADDLVKQAGQRQCWPLRRFSPGNRSPCWRQSVPGRGEPMISKPKDSGASALRSGNIATDRTVSEVTSAPLRNRGYCHSRSSQAVGENFSHRPPMSHKPGMRVLFGYRTQA